MQYTKITRDLFDRLEEQRERQEFKKVLSSLEVNQGIAINMSDWKLKNHPRSEAMNYQVSVKHKMKFTTKTAGETFAILRTA